MIENEPIKTSRKGQKALLFVWFVTMVCGWLFLIFHVPMLLQQVFPDFLLDRDSGIATLALSNRNVQSPWSQEINFDVHSGELDWKMSREVDDVFFCSGTDPKKNEYRILPHHLQMTDGSYRSASPPGSGIPDRDFQFPQYPYQINDRFAVACDVGDLVVMDFTDENLAIKGTKVGGIQIAGGLRAIEGVDGFLRFQNLPVLGNPPSHQVQHFTIDENQNAVPGLIWQAISLSTYPYQCTENTGGQIVSINPTNFEVEFRDAADGKFIESMPLLEGMAPVTLPCGFWGNYLRLEPTTGSPRFLDLKRRKWLPVIGGESFSPVKELDDKFILFVGKRGNGWNKRTIVFDINQSICGFRVRLSYANRFHRQRFHS